MMRMAKLQNIIQQDLAQILFPRRMASTRIRYFSSKLEDAAREDKLDFITASKILFSPPSKPKKFGIDFHLVQFFFACMPSLAVFLVAQYARYDMRKMEAELEEKKRLEEAKLAEEQEQESQPSSEGGTPWSLKKHDVDGKLSGSSEVSTKEKEEVVQELKSRLDALEEIVKEMTTAEARKTSGAVRAEPQLKQVKQPSNEKVASTHSKVDVSKNIEGKLMSKDSALADNVNSIRATSQSNKNSPAGGESSSKPYVDNQGSNK